MSQPRMIRRAREGVERITAGRDERTLVSEINDLLSGHFSTEITGEVGSVIVYNLNIGKVGSKDFEVDVRSDGRVYVNLVVHRSKKDLRLVLKGRASPLVVNAVVYGAGDSVQEMELDLEDDASVDSLFVGLDDASFLVKGMVKGRKGSRSAFSVRALLFDRSRFRAIPSLKASSGDLSMSHGVVVERVSDDVSFYLQSRGIPEADLREMIINSRVNKIIHTMESSFAEVLER